MSDRPTGVKLLRLPHDLCRYDFDCAFGMSYDGKAYVISTEGVGWEITDEGIEFDYEETPLSTFDIMKRIYDDDSIRSEDRAVDLADWVRTFGARLEGNFWLWHERLSKKD